jgi:hypothetical protein
VREAVPDNYDILDYYASEEERLKRRYHKNNKDKPEERSDEDD